MKRIFALLLAVVMLAGLVPTMAQEAPAGVFLGTWPYVLKPDHNLNSFSPNGPTANLGVVYWQLVEMPAAFYKWAADEYVGLLAESWGFVDGGYELTLKEATWSDGSPVTADDVVATYGIGRILGWSQFNTVASVEKVADRTVRFVWSGEPSLLAERLILKENIRPAATYGALAEEALALAADGKTRDDQEWKDLNAKINDFRPDALLASGPYTYTLDDVGDSYMSLFWQPNSLYSGTVNFGEIRLWAGETEVTTPLVLNGDIAWSTNVYPPATQQAFQDAGIRLLIQPRGYGPSLLFNHDVAPWNIKEVRQVAALVIDRSENAFLTNGFGATGTQYMAGILDAQVPNMLTQDVIDQLNPYTFNPEAAADIMTQLGYTRNDAGKWVDAEGNTIKSEYKFPGDFADFSAAAQNATDQLNEFGFDITPRAVPWQQARDDIFAGNFELSVWSWGAGSPFAFSHLRNPVIRFNYAGLGEGQPGMNFPMEFEWRGEQINLTDLINNVNVGLDVAAQQERAGKIALILNDLMPFIPLNIILSTEPWNEAELAGAPADDDPILQNPSSDSFVILYLLEGQIAPAGG
ncbi:MAG: ABC transporter substrate-binding protein [Anaerolineae bacterium]|nr:ABC transporter substrate-binding protein [Anaerolineae bacterium]